MFQFPVSIERLIDNPVAVGETFTMKAINITRLAKKKGPGYAAKDRVSGRVVLTARRLDILWSRIIRLDKSRQERLVISWIPKYGAKYVFNVSIRLR